ncbi:PR-1-like protein [Mycena indigotica]|uniref:PR-1-like protein n=1 Tax=Mycena indigotica TaxID=2126181 RepID=A0A8H6SQ46_9AGAR|nr:PR-1-like protein [Mycena indigotica]KAF7303379.1 PR-1-like protein [Mycena indigotica]
MAGPRPPASRSSPCSSRPRCPAPPPCSHGDHKGAHYGRKRTRNGRPARPFAKGRPTANAGRRRQRHAQAQHHRRPAPRTPGPATATAGPLHPPPGVRARPGPRSPPARSTPGAAVAPLVSAADQALYLKFHNDIRANHKGDPLSWNDTLSAAAQKVADTCVFEHSGGKVGPFGREPRGGHGQVRDREGDRVVDERSVSALFSLHVGVGAEAKAEDYDPKNPVPSHFTQVVWRGTTQVGCALTVCAPGTIFDPKFTNTAEYYVCEYAPPGNIMGQFDQMVSV